MNSLYRKYLSDDYLKKIQNNCMSPHDNLELLKKYNNILRIVSTYIPQNIVTTKIEDVHDKTHSGRFVEGTLLFADVSGFTALTEKLSSQGYEGSEEITRILNDFFLVMVEIIFQYRGILLKYGGDAMMIYFSMEKDFCGEDHVYQAVSCAHDMQKAMSRFTVVESKFGSFSLQMSMSVHSNTFFETIVGDENLHSEYFLTGSGVEETAFLESLAGKGDILLDKNTYSQIQDHVKGFSKKEKYYLIEDFDSKKMPLVTQSHYSIDYDNIDDILARLDVLLNFVIRGVYDKIKLSWQSLVLEGEYRPVTVAFLNFYFLSDLHKDFNYQDEDAIQSIYDEYFQMVQRNVASHDGTINKIDMYDKGDKIIIIFGFPQSHADDEKRAVQCMHSIMEEGKNFIDKKVNDVDFSIHQKAGIHSGFIFCGNVGSPLRQEYTIIGDSVNISARLMSAAKANEILISDSILQETSNIVKIKYTDQKKFKGKSKKMSIHAIESIRDHDAAKNEFFVGREKELNLLDKRLNNAEGSFYSTQIIGPAGMGKTFLIQEFLRNSVIEHEIIGGRGLAIGSNIQYHAIKEMLMLIFGVIPKDSDETVKAKIDRLISFLKLDNLKYSIPLLGVLLSKAYKDEPVFEIEDTKEKKELLCSTFYHLIQAKCELNPCIFYCEDGEWFDHNTIEVLDYLIKRGVKDLFIIILSRKELSLKGNIETFILKPFDEKEIHSFIDAYPHIDKIPSTVEKQIQEKSHGVPYFIFELLNSIRDRGINSRLPNSIYKSILSRLDELDEKNKDLIKKASVFGVSFKQDLLQKLIDEKIDIDSAIEDIIKEDYIVKDNEDEYVFRNMMVQEVTYNLLSVTKRKKLHAKIAEIIENEGDLTPYYEILAYHYKMSDANDKALYYFEKSGDKAVQLNNFPNAVEFFDMALSLMEKKKKKKPKVLANILGKKGKVLLSEGEYSKSQESFSASRKVAVESKLENEIAYADLNLGEIYMQRGSFQKALTTLHKAAALYDKKKNYNQLGKCYVNIGTIEKLLGESQNAYDYYDKAIMYYEKENNVSGIAEVFTNKGNLAKELSDFDRALESYNKAMEYFHEIDHEFGKASILNNIGTLYNSLGKYKEAIEHFRKSQKIEEKIGNQKGEIICFNNLGNSYSLLRSWEIADEYFLQGLEIAQQIRDTKELSNIFLNRGVMYLLKEEYNVAIDLIDNAIKYFLIDKDGYGLYTAYYNCALIYQKQNNVDLALQNFDKALNEAKFLDASIFMKGSLNIAQSHFMMNKNNRALEIVNGAIEMSEKFPVSTMSAELYTSGAKYYSALNDDDNAIKYLQKSQQLSFDMNDDKTASYTGIKLAQYYMDKNSIEEAKNELNRSISFFKKNNVVVGKIYSLIKLASVYEKIEDLEAANAQYRNCLDELKKINFHHQMPYIYKKIALNYKKVNKLSKAIEAIEKAIIHEEEQAAIEISQSYYILGDIYLKKRNLSEAIENYEKGFDYIASTDTDQREKMALKIGTLCKNSGNSQKALHYFSISSASQKSETKIIAYKQLAVIYDGIGDAKCLKETLVSITSLEQNSETEKNIAKSIKSL